MTIAITNVSALRHIRYLRMNHRGMHPLGGIAVESLTTSMHEVERVGLGGVATADRPLHLLDPSYTSHDRSRRLRLHRWSDSLPPGPFMSYADDVVTAGPEFCALSLMRGLSLIDRALLVSELCGRFSVHPDGQCFLACQPATSTERLIGFARNRHGTHGTRLLRDAAHLAADGARSPFEAIMRLWLGGGTARLGGFGCRGSQLNYPVQVGEGYGAGSARAVIREVDIAWPTLRFGVECDGSQHAVASHASGDALRDMQLGAVGWCERRIWWRQMRSYNTACLFGDVVRSELGLSRRTTDRPLAARRVMLWRSLMDSPWAGLSMGDG